MKYLDKEKTGKALFELQGVNGELFVYDDKVILERKGPIAFLIHGLKGTKTILFMDIADVRIEEGSITENGYISFDIINENVFEGSVVTATQDENTVMIKNTQNDIAKEIKEYIDRRRN